MFAPFSPGDSPRVYRLQRRSMALDLQQDLMQPQRPLWGAWLAFLTQQAMGLPTYVLYDLHHGEAFVQVRFRPHQAAADVVWMAPTLAEHGQAAPAWLRLLDGVSVEAGGQGIQRVFAGLPGSGPEVDVFQQAGFAVYAGEDIYRLLPRDWPPSEEALPSLRPQQPEDWPALQKLCVAVTPQRVRESEGGIGLPLAWEKNCQRYVLTGGDGGDVLAAVTVCPSVQSHWLRILLHPGWRHMARALVDWGLAALDSKPPRAVYCNVRHYENSVREVFASAELEPFATRSLMVKHTLAWIKNPLPETVTAMKGSAEPLPPTYRINGESESLAASGFIGPEGRLAVHRQYE